MAARDFNTGSTTMDIFSEVEYNIDLPDNIFTERFLRRPPKQALRKN